MEPIVVISSFALATAGIVFGATGYAGTKDRDEPNPLLATCLVLGGCSYVWLAGWLWFSQ